MVIPTCNRAGLLPRAVRSVLAQTYTDFEMLIVDDASTDGTPSVVDGFADRRIRSIRHERNGGQSMALNTGIAAARGEYVAFLDDDDAWLPHKLAAQVAVLDAAPPEVGLVYGWASVVDETRNRVALEYRQTMHGDIFEQILALYVPTPPSFWLVRTSAARAIGGFDESVHQANDLDFCTRLCERGWQVDYVPSVVLLKYRHDNGQMVDRTTENLAAYADSVRGHLTRFARELSTRPRASAAVHLRLAGYEWGGGRRGAALRSAATALRLSPLLAIWSYIPDWSILRFPKQVAIAAWRRRAASRSRTAGP